MRTSDREQECPFSCAEIPNRWYSSINERLSLDRSLTNLKYGKKALRKKLVITTWRGILRNEHRLLDDWTETTGVLVVMDHPCGYGVGDEEGVG